MKTFPSWIPIAELASKEMDSAKLMLLIDELCTALDAERKDKASRMTAAI